MNVKDKVRLIRSLELPESVIVDFLSADLHPRIGARGGPEDANDVRVKAAKIVLAYELPGTPAANRVAGQSAAQPRAVQATKAPVAGAWLLVDRDTFARTPCLTCGALMKPLRVKVDLSSSILTGDGFALGNGTPVRFWGVHLNAKSDAIILESAHRVISRETRCEHGPTVFACLLEGKERTQNPTWIPS